MQAWVARQKTRATLQSWCGAQPGLSTAAREGPVQAPSIPLHVHMGMRLWAPLRVLPFPSPLLTLADCLQAGEWWLRHPHPSVRVDEAVVQQR